MGRNRKGRWHLPAAFLLHIQQNFRPFLYLLFDHPQALCGQVIPWVLLEAERQQMPQFFPQFRRQNVFCRAEEVIVYAGSQRFDVFLQRRVV